ncbi:DUF3883 domain-containing protein [Gimesia benthica]|uniref:DUF3883 domain-containing protein n=1 Tax=Gimesia benthica TaxID=2608982 RepID=A0A6I6A6C8_9PLAN|nr:DUF3883 domain-containing protein [Gimesia benthica]QGQ21964.1 DUF3883 domain-containing protein [Gimesia benthica]
MPQSIPAGLTKYHILKTLADLNDGVKHPFGPSTGYELVYEQKRYAPKTVVGLACRYSIGRILLPEEFSGGEAPGQANFVLRKLGFTVVRKGDGQEEPQTGKDWNENEVRLIIADYFDMLEAELLDKKYKKSEHRKALIPKLVGRSEGSIEFKHQNISAVMVEQGWPYIEGYKPRGNYQGLLAAAVDSFLDENPNVLRRIETAPLLNPSKPKSLSNPDFGKVIVDPPEVIKPPKPAEKPWLSRRAKKIDFAERDAQNRKLGTLAEQFVFDLERHRLNVAGRDDLAQKVVWASKVIGDGLGFDILSFDEADDSERMLEVKATGLGKFFPFYVTSNELRCSEDIPEQFQLFRVFDFGRSPRLYILHGSLSQLCQLDPVLYRATL